MFGKAAVLYGPEQLVVEEIEFPAPKRDEILIRVKATAICGTDVAIYKGAIGLASYPMVLGHESAGIVQEVGAAVKGFSVGDHVIINPAYFCGECFYCKRKLYNLCSEGGLLGRDRYGSFAEYVSIPAAAVLPLPEAISFEDASTIQSLATVLRGWERIEEVRSPSREDVIAVIGLGMPGLIFTRLSALTGAKVFSSTRTGWKLDIAEKFGGIPVHAKDGDLKKAVLEATDGRGADYVIEAAGTARTFQSAMEIARPGGIILAFGIQHKLDGVDGYNFYYKELTILGTRAMNNEGYQRAIKLYRQGDFDLAPLVTDRFELSEAKQYFEMMDRDAGGHLRVVCHL